MRPLFDPVIHPRTRLRVCAVLAPLDEVEFAVVRDLVAVSDSVLSKQTAALEEAGYVAVAKRAVGGRQRTWLALTPAGRHAFRGHMAELSRLATLPADTSAQPPPTEVP